MEIDFNPSRIPKSDSGTKQPVPLRSAAPTVSQVGSFQNTASLTDSLQDVPLVRPEQVDRAQSLVADLQYPPDKLLAAISALLAFHLK